MTIVFNKQRLDDVLTNLSTTLKELTQVRASVSLTDQRTVKIRLKRWGTTTLTFSVSEAPAPYIQTTLTLTDKKVAWAHRRFILQLDTAVRNVAEKAGGVVTVPV